jgi:mRNA interferase RelE/StbE
MTKSNEQQYSIQISKTPKRFIERLPNNVAKRIVKAIDGLADNPRPTGCRKLEGYEFLYRIRVGDWRIVYAIYDEQVLIVVVEVATRGNAYKNL